MVKTDFMIKLEKCFTFFGGSNDHLSSKKGKVCIKALYLKNHNFEGDYTLIIYWHYDAI